MLGNLLQDFMTDEGQIKEDRDWIWNRYGTAYRAAWRCTCWVVGGGEGINLPGSAEIVAMLHMDAAVLFL